MWHRNLDDWVKRLLEDVYERAPPFDLIGNSPFEVYLGRVASERGLEAQTLRRISFLRANNIEFGDCSFTEQEAQRIHVDSIAGFNKEIYSDPRRLSSQFKLRKAHVAKALDGFRGTRCDVKPLVLLGTGSQYSIQATVERGGLLYLTSVSGSFGKLPALHARLRVMTEAHEDLGDVYVPNAFLDLGRELTVSEDEFERLCQTYLSYTNSVIQWILREA